MMWNFVFMRNGEIDSEWEQGKSWLRQFVLEKQESESFLRAFDRTTNNRLTQQREKILMLIDVS